MQNTNLSRDEIRQQGQQSKRQLLQEKWNYYWTHHRLSVITILLAALMLGSMFRTILTRVDTILSVAYINAFPNVKDEKFMEGFNQFLGINPKRQTTRLDSGYYIQKNWDSPYTTNHDRRFCDLVMSGKLDAVVADEASFQNYANQGFFQDLSSFLSPALLETYGSSLLYYDLPYDEINKAVPVGINVTNSPGIRDTASYPNSSAYFGIVVESQHVDNALSFLSYLETPPKH